MTIIIKTAVEINVVDEEIVCAVLPYSCLVAIIVGAATVLVLEMVLLVVLYFAVVD